MAIGLRLSWKLQNLGFRKQKDGSFIYQYRKNIIEVFPNMTYTHNIKEVSYKGETDRALQKLGLKYSGKATSEIKIDKDTYIKILLKNKFYFDDDINMYCKDFKTHSTCLDLKTMKVDFYCDDLKDFLKGNEERKERWKKRFAEMHINIDGFGKTEEYS